MAADACMVLSTLPSEQEAAALARQLVERQLAACVQLMPICSVYRWEGAIEQAAEMLLLIKTTSARYGELEVFIRAVHPYAVPEIIQLPITEGSADYLRWLGEQLIRS